MRRDAVRAHAQGGIGQLPPRTVFAVVALALAACLSLAMRADRPRGMTPSIGDSVGTVAQASGTLATIRELADRTRGALRRDAALVTQVRSPWLIDGPAASSDCGPAATIAALRMVGLDVPGARGRHDEALLARARKLATGSTRGLAQIAPNAATYLPQLAKLAHASGARTRETSNVPTALSWVRSGVPVVVQGRPLHAWDERLPTRIVRHVVGGHYVTVAGAVAGTTDRWWLLEPLGVRGPIIVTTTELERYVADWNGAAMAVQPSGNGLVRAAHIARTAA